jgi:hypothetical protein
VNDEEIHNQIKNQNLNKVSENKKVGNNFKKLAMDSNKPPIDHTFPLSERRVSSKSVYLT